MFISPNHPPATFMPTTFDQYGQPIVMMPYPSPPPAAATGPADQFDANDNNAALEVENQIPAEGLIVVDESIVVVDNELTENGDSLAAAEVPALIQEEEKEVILLLLDNWDDKSNYFILFRSRLSIPRNFLKSQLQL